MANPNIVNVTTINGNNSLLAVTTSFQALINNPASSGKIYKINNITASNIDVANTSDVSVQIYTEDDLGGTGYSIANSIPIPFEASLIVVDKTNSFYLKEDQSIGISANVDSHINVSASWEEIS